uniref:Low-density lipoprotein receptor-related protein 2-like n=1 Tax=Saccoglossus kowalevskii TaxID=10224 RepID=A0ABM0MHE4_SACKO|nr:PREDICTED: low-density lipoprotein receptor-related protein 2-like [Saccoglossus kowalevskii]
MNPTEWATTESNTLVPDTDTVNSQSISNISGTTYRYNKTRPPWYSHMETAKTEPSANFADTTSSISSIVTMDTHPIPTTVACLSTQFQYSNGHCIPSVLRCDGVNNCNDDSDEVGCQACLSTQFQCSNGHCIPSGFRCNGINNCNDDSDEVGCQGCTMDQFKCQREACIDLYRMCDGSTDCNHPYDEAYCNGCGEGNFQCMDGLYCVPDVFVCDRGIDCRDGSDEYGPQCSWCSVTEFTCDGTKCIPLSDVCNGVSNCDDNADEIDCDHVCGPSKYYCGNGYCIGNEWVCDTVLDCMDNSDENGCE